MKTIISFILLFSFVFTSNSTSIFYTDNETCLWENSKTILSKRMVRKIKRDAARLTLRITQEEEEDLRYQDITLDDELYSELFEMLKNIYVSTPEGQRLAKCKIHTYPDLPIDRFKIIFDKNIGWAESFKNGIFETPDASLNELINTFDLVIDKYIQWNDDFDAVTIRSKKFLNIKALANDFFNIEGIEEIDYGVPSLKGNDIKVTKVGQEYKIKFELALGSQMKKNSDKHNWLFEIKRNKVKFIKEDGPTLPDYIKCDLPKSIFVLN